MKRFTAIAVVASTSSHAGFGGMSSIENEDAGTGDLSGMVLLVGAYSFILEIGGRK